MSWLLSPSSATKITATLIRNALTCPQLLPGGRASERTRRVSSRIVPDRVHDDYMQMMNPGLAAPAWDVSQWFNTPAPISLEGLRGQVVVIEAFQMLCPGCVSHGLPQAQRVAATFGGDVTLIGLHTVFEHHEAMTPTALEAFLYEYRIGFPVGVDNHRIPRGMPVTMTRYGLQGTPSLVLVDRRGDIRMNALGRVDDLVLGAALARLIDEPAPGDAPGGAV